MVGRFPLLPLLLAAALCGCASVPEERVARLEATVIDLQVQEIRIAVLEDKVNTLLAGAPAKEPAKEPEATPVSPRRVEPVPAPLAPAPVPQAPAKASPNISAAYRKALSTLEAGRPAAAMALFRDFLQAHPGHELAPNAGYWLGECHYTLKQYDSAIIAFKDVVAQYPAHAKAPDAMLKAGYSYSLLGDTANARFYLDALLKDYPASRSAPLAREKLASW